MASAASRLTSSISAAALVAFVLAAAGLAACGGDEEPEQPAAADTGTGATGTAPAGTETDEGTVEQPAPEEQPGDEPAATASPEDQPGGAGDEEPIRVDARFELGGGQFSPRQAQVPAFLSIELVVVPGGDAGYEIEVEGPREAAGGSGTGGEPFRAVLEGLRPDERYVVRDKRSGARAEIVASAEPGP